MTYCVAAWVRKGRWDVKGRLRSHAQLSLLPSAWGRGRTMMILLYLRVMYSGKNYVCGDIIPQIQIVQSKNPICTTWQCDFSLHFTQSHAYCVCHGPEYILYFMATRVCSACWHEIQNIFHGTRGIHEL